MSDSPYPPKFTQFLLSNGIQLSDVEADKLPRFIRINPSRTDPNAVIEALEKETGCTCASVDWMPPALRFYSLDSSARISGCPAYESGDVFGMDVASAVAVIALGIESNDHVLDLCCAPGGKMCLVADIQGNADDVVGTVTGVDISRARISTCKSVLRKYKMRRFRLFEADGTNFDVHAPSRVGKWTRSTLLFNEPIAADGTPNISKSDPVAPEIPSKRKVENDGTGENPAKKPNQTKVKPFHATKLVIGDHQIKSAALLYDKVLVDAECTHDGSIAHLKKCNQMGWDKFEATFFDPAKMDNLETLQRGLISNGFRLLKPGGILVYSTCSFLKRQNEDIINWFLAANAGCAVLESVPGSDKFPVAKALDGESQHMLRFTPTASNTSGLFVARIRKI
ncbi:putative ribosomal RNA small subunit methyltransferase [Chytriomyces cf. hyalinus JEL632]|nr:putative ribosomal RNA small subunit methyltransferase [Chytriomyces cf. hyalinus JEL632]